MWIVGLCFRFVKTGSPACRTGLLITIYQPLSSKRTCVGGYRHFPPSGHNRDLKLAFSKPNLSLISTWPCGSVVPNCLWATYRFPAVLCSRVSFRLSVRQAAPALSCRAVPFFCIAKCPIRAHKRRVIVGNDGKDGLLAVPHQAQLHIVPAGDAYDLRDNERGQPDGGGQKDRLCCFARNDLSATF